MVDGTPVLDIKPYITTYDSFENSRIPDWIKQTVNKERIVNFQNDSEVKLKELVEISQLQFYNSFDEIKSAIIQILSVDIRSKEQIKKSKNNTFKQIIDNILITFHQDDDIVNIVNIEKYIFTNLNETNLIYYK